MRRAKPRVTTTSKYAAENSRDKTWDRWARTQAAGAKPEPVDRPSQIIRPGYPVWKRGHRPLWCPVCRKKACLS